MQTLGKSSLFTGVAQLRWDKPGHAGGPHGRASVTGEKGGDVHREGGLIDQELGGHRPKLLSSDA